MKIERVITWFDKSNGKELGEFNVDNISLEVLVSIFNPPSEDYLMYGAYDITEKEVDNLKKYIDFEFYLDKHYYELDCFQSVYDGNGNQKEIVDPDTIQMTESLVPEKKLDNNTYMKVVRSITWYDKNSNEYIGEFNIDQYIGLEELENIFEKYPNDPLMYMVYDINVQQAEELAGKVFLKFEFDKYKYNLDCYQG
jgi:hypothetical protein